MGVLGEISASLDAMGAEQQACMFAFLMSYPLSLGALLEARGRRIAAGVALASAGGLAVLTDPWMHAVLVIVAVLGGGGVFIAAAWLADDLSQRIAWRGVRAPRPTALSEPAVSVPTPARVVMPLRARQVLSVQRNGRLR